jgi:DNA-binding NtrC family response regulator
MTERRLRLLIVEDEAAILKLLARCATGWGYEVIVAATRREAIRKLAEQPEIVLLDVRLPDGTGIDVAAHAARSSPVPAIVALTGLATRTESFQLAELGVLELLEKPVRLRDLRASLLRALVPPQDPFQRVRRCVGHVPWPELQRDVRREMLTEALAQSHGNVSQAARLLGVTRQAVQKHLR